MDEKSLELSKHRLQRAAQCLSSSKLLIDAGDLQSSANRSYYCVFHCMRSVLALEEVDFAKHAGVISYFRKNYIKTGIFDVNLSKIIAMAFDMRSDSDYEDYYVIEKSDAWDLFANAKIFYDAIENYLQEEYAFHSPENIARLQKARAVSDEAQGKQQGLIEESQISY